MRNGTSFIGGVAAINVTGRLGAHAAAIPVTVSNNRTVFFNLEAVDGNDVVNVESANNQHGNEQPGHRYRRRRRRASPFWDRSASRAELVLNTVDVKLNGLMNADVVHLVARGAIFDGNGDQTNIAASAAGAWSPL